MRSFNPLRIAAAALVVACAGSSSDLPFATEISAGGLSLATDKTTYSIADVSPGAAGIRATLTAAVDKPYYAKLGDAFNGAVDQNPAALRHVARSERIPVDRAAQDDIGTPPFELLAEKHSPVVPGNRMPEQRRTGLVAPVDRRHLEVVPLRPVEVDRDRAVAEGFADRSRDGVEQRGKILTRPQKAGHLDEAPQR